MLYRCFAQSLHPKAILLLIQTCKPSIHHLPNAAKVRKENTYTKQASKMCETFYQTYSNCDCFLIKILYCALATQLLGTPCPQIKEKAMQFPFKCGLKDCPRLETELKFELQREAVEAR